MGTSDGAGAPGAESTRLTQRVTEGADEVDLTSS